MSPVDIEALSVKVERVPCFVVVVFCFVFKKKKNTDKLCSAKSVKNFISAAQFAEGRPCDATSLKRAVKSFFSFFFWSETSACSYSRDR